MPNSMSAVSLLVGDHPWVIGRRGLERGVLLVFGHSKQLSQNKSFDPSTPFMRKGRDGGKD